MIFGLFFFSLEAVFGLGDDDDAAAGASLVGGASAESPFCESNLG